MNNPTSQLTTRDTYPRVGIIIVNWNSFDLLADCLSALDRQTYPIERIIVVDNASESRPSELPDTKQFATRYLLLNENTGFAAANNRAMAMLDDCDLIGLVNPDAFPTPDWLDTLVIAVTGLPNAASVAGHTLQYDNAHTLDGYGDAYHVIGLPFRQGYGKSIDTLPTEMREIFSACAAAALYRRDALELVGGFDEDFFCYCEDVDLGFRLRLAGYSHFYIPGAATLHIGSATTGSNLSDVRIYYGHRNTLWLYVKNMPAILFWMLMPLHIAGRLLVITYFTMKGKGRVILRAQRDAIAGLPAALRKRRSVQASRKTSTRSVWQMLSKKSIN